MPDVLASTANLLKTNGWRAGAPFGDGSANFDVMSEWNRSVVYRKTMVSLVTHADASFELKAQALGIGRAKRLSVARKRLRP